MQPQVHKRTIYHMAQNNISIHSVNNCLKMQLNIPAYQRPYKWGIQSINEMLRDIQNAIEKSKGHSGFKYRMGTIILHQNNKFLDIVDGQQRIVSLSLINLYLDNKFNNNILQFPFSNKISQSNIHNNYQHIREWFALHPGIVQDFKRAMKDILEMVVICVQKESDAFQLFDSQNTRGKALNPHDLLKAYHLREMLNDRYAMEYAVNKWETQDMSAIRELFNSYLFPIWNWSRGVKTRFFTDKEIDTYKGITLDTQYTYAHRASKAMPYFQITEPIIAGADFFEMVDHYLRMLKNIQTELKTNPAFAYIKDICFKEKQSIGMQHATLLFYSVLLFYYDKFHNMDELAIKKLFIWAYMLRLDLDSLSQNSVNKYAIGEWSGNYTNNIAMFAHIGIARMHTDIGNIQIKTGYQSSETPEKNELNEVIENLLNKQ